MIIRYKDFKEAVANGIEPVGFTGVGYPDENPQQTLGMIWVLLCDVDNKFYTQDDFISLSIEYLKLGGEKLHEFSIENLNKIVSFLKKNMVS